MMIQIPYIEINKYISEKESRGSHYMENDESVGFFNGIEFATEWFKKESIEFYKLRHPGTDGTSALVEFTKFINNKYPTQ